MIFQSISSKKWLFILILFSMIIFGCATPNHKTLNVDLGKRLYHVDVLSNIANEKIYINFTKEQKISTTGDIFVVDLFIEGINLLRSTAAKNRVKPIHEAASDFDFKTLFWEELEKNLSTSPWLKTNQLDQWVSHKVDKKINKMKPPALILSTHFLLSPNSQILIIQTKASLFLRRMKKPDYFGYFTYYSNKVSKKSEDEKAIRLWAADNAAIYRQVIREGVEHNMLMLRLDLLDHPANPKIEKGRKIKLRIRDPFSDEMVTLRGYQVSGDNERMIMRDKSGNLFSISPYIEELK